LERRWLPEEINSLGTYALSEAKQNELGSGSGNPYLSITMEWTGKCTELRGFFIDLEKPEFVEHAYKTFIKAYTQYSEIIPTQGSKKQILHKIQASLREQLLNISEEISKYLDLWRTCSKGWYSLPELKEDLTEICNNISENEQTFACHQENITTTTSAVNLAKSHIQLAAQALEDEPFWHGMLGFLPFVKGKRKAKSSTFLLQNNIYLDRQPANLQEAYDSLNNELYTAQKNIQQLRHK